MTLRPGKSSRKAGTKGQPEGSAVTGNTRKPGAANQDLVSGNAAGQNNSNLTPWVTSVTTGEWELILGIVPIFVFIFFPNSISLTRLFLTNDL
jgi:hypothetical protein